MTDENNALENLDRLDQVEPDEDQADPWETDAAAEQEADAEQLAREAAAAHGAALAVSFSHTLLTLKYPFVEVDESTKGAIEEKTAAVLVKHGGGLPEWLEPYREEIELGMVLAVAGYGITVQVKQHEQAEAEQAEREAAKNADATSEPE